MISGSEVADICSKYRINGTYVAHEQLTVGLIHSSYKVSTTDATYFLQEINTMVFPHVAQLMQNVALVTHTLKEALAETGYETLDLIFTKSGDTFLSHEGKYWRMFAFKSQLQSHEFPHRPTMAAEAGKAFAWFSKGLSNLNPALLHVTIPKFHSLTFRIQQLTEAEKANPVGAEKVSDELKIIAWLAEKLLPLEQAWHSGQLPTRITHNDTKFNNLLFDKYHKAICVIDLDTVMPGVIHFDIGDCLRLLASSAAEDEANLSKVTMLAEPYQHFLESYIAVYQDVITSKEMDYIHYSAPYMALIMAVRFLTDHLRGNVYFTVANPMQNLVRAKCQLKMAQAFVAQLL